MYSQCVLEQPSIKGKVLTSGSIGQHAEVLRAGSAGHNDDALLGERAPLAPQVFPKPETTKTSSTGHYWPLLGWKAILEIVTSCESEA